MIGVLLSLSAELSWSKNFFSFLFLFLFLSLFLVSLTFASSIQDSWILDLEMR